MNYSIMFIENNSDFSYRKRGADNIRGLHVSCWGEIILGVFVSNHVHFDNLRKIRICHYHFEQPERARKIVTHFMRKSPLLDVLQ